MGAKVKQSRAITVIIVVFTLIIVIGLVLLSSFIPSQQPGSLITNASSNSWPMFLHDASHTSFSEGAAPIASVTQLWNYTADASAAYPSITHTPVISGGFAYVATADEANEERSLYGVSCLSSTGEVVWNFLTEGFPFNIPAVGGDRVYVGSGSAWNKTEGYIYCLNASNGAQVWNSSVGEPVYAPITFADGRVFVESLGGNLYCLDAANGAKVWNYSTGGKTNSLLCPAVADGNVFVGNEDGNVLCIGAANGDLIWNFTANGSVSSPAVTYGYVYFGSADGNAYCINASSGEKVWNYTTWFNTAGPAHNYHWGNQVGEPAVAYGHVYVGSSDFDLFCIDAFTGAKVWNVTIGATGVPPAVANGYVYLSSYDGNVHCLNASSGVEYWRYVVGSFSRIDSGIGAPVIANGEVYVTSRQEASGIRNVSEQGVVIVLGYPPWNHP